MNKDLFYEKLRQLGRLLRHTVIPNRCLWCNKLIKYDLIACPDCLDMLPDKPMIFKLYRDCTCISSFPYRNPYKKVLVEMKFDSKPRLAKQMGYYMSLDILNNFDINKFHLITAVPMHRIMQRRRGYNQAELLAKNVSKRLSIPYLAVLVKLYQNEPQHKLNFAERAGNVRGLFSCADKNAVKGKNILLVDDTVTSGNTLMECCRILTKAGASSVTVATFSRSK